MGRIFFEANEFSLKSDSSSMLETNSILFVRSVAVRFAWSFMNDPIGAGFLKKEFGN